MAAGLRVLDFGTVSALRSQSLWHGFAHGVDEGAPITLAFLRPASPYVCLGYHSRLAEVNLQECEDRGLPVYRRMVGGGPVYLDNQQLFFQLCLPADQVPAHRAQALEQLLGPAVSGFAAAGLVAHLDQYLEIVAGQRKLCGHGAGQIEGAVLVVGNLIEGFDHAAATAVMAAPTAEARAEVERLMRRFVGPAPEWTPDPDAFKSAVVAAYADALGLAPEPGELSASEWDWVARMDGRLGARDWVAGSFRPAPDVWQVKIRAGVYVAQATVASTQLLVSVVDGVIESARIDETDVSPAQRSVAASLGAKMAGCSVSELGSVLTTYGDVGERVRRAVAALRIEGRIGREGPTAASRPPAVHHEDAGSS